MPRGPQAHAAERVDLDDYTAGVRTFTQDSVAQLVDNMILDNQSRIRRGFRIELPTQTSYPGRIVVHAGDGYDFDGRKLLNEDQLTASRTITLEGSTTTFYVELEFVEGDGDVDGRAFWDPTVDNGLDTSGDELPDGQEFSDNVATTKVTDWRIATPISTSAFARTADPTSTRIPLAMLATDGSNLITSVVNTGLVTENPATTLLEVVSTTIIRVQDAHLFLAGNDIDVGEGAASSETMTIGSVDIAKGLITLTGALVNSHDPEEICRAEDGGTTALNLITESSVSRYRRDEVGAAAPDHEIDVRDKLFQGDEVHGHHLSRGHGSITDRSDLSLQSLKDHIDFLAAKLQEIQWGHTDPWESGTSTERIPPGLGGAIVSAPRYFDRPEGSLAGARVAAITVGDGTNSWGDLNGTSQVVLQAAHDALPSVGGRIFLKRGVYTLTSNVLWTNTGSVTLEGEEGSIIELDGGSININTTGTVKLAGITIQRDSGSATAETGIEIVTATPTKFDMDHVNLFDCSFDLAILIPGTSQISGCRFETTHATMNARPLIRSTNSAAVLSGVWAACIFLHNTFDTAGGYSCIDLVTTPPTISATLLDFVDCTVSTITNANLHLGEIHLGATLSAVQFTRCKFGALAALNHVVASGGTNLKFNECVSVDAIATVINATNVDYLEIDGATNSIFTGILLPFIQLVDCSFSKISNCTMTINTVTPFPGNAGIKIVASGEDIGDIVIENNTIIATVDDVTGIMFDVSSYDMRRVRIVNNYMNLCTVGIALLDSTANDYEEFVISGNQIKDGATAGDAASYLRIGIYGGATANYNRMLITDNQIVNCNPTNSDVVVSGTSRHGIIIKGTMDESSISGNQISNVGNSANRMDLTSAIRISDPDNTTIANNVIDVVSGGITYGILFGEATATSGGCTITGNKITGLDADANDCFAISCYAATQCSISNNTCTGGTGSSVVAMVGVNDLSNGRFENCAFSGNVFSGGDTGAFMFYLHTNILRYSTFVGNSCSGVYDKFFDATITAGGNIQYVTISGNTSYNAVTGNILIAGSTGTCEFLTVNNNNLHTSGSYNLSVAAALQVSVSANVFKSTSSTGDNITITGTEEIVIIANVMGLDTVGTGDSINLRDSGNAIYLVAGNLMRGSTVGDNVATNGSGSTGQSLLFGNLYDGTNHLNTSDYGVDTYALLSGSGLVGRVF